MAWLISPTSASASVSASTYLHQHQYLHLHMNLCIASASAYICTSAIDSRAAVGLQWEHMVWLLSRRRSRRCEKCGSRPLSLNYIPSERICFGVLSLFWKGFLIFLPIWCDTSLPEGCFQINPIQNAWGVMDKYFLQYLVQYLWGPLCHCICDRCCADGIFISDWWLTTLLLPL